MKRIVKFILATVLFMLYTSNIIFAAEPAFSGKAAILTDGNSGRILYAQNIDQKLPMASTTKIMTAIVALEKGNLDDIVVVPPEAQGVEGSSIWLSAGERHTLEDLLYGLMLRSGNDAATAIAYHIGGDIEGFVRLMNEKAGELGAVNTNFMNPHGLHDDNHYTTARDLAIITAYALKNPAFEKIVSTKNKSIPWDGHKWDRAMRNKNRLLWQYEGANGVKTGFTKKAGRCLVSSAKRDGLQLIAVVLNCGPMFEESISLLDYGFSEFECREIASEGAIAGKVRVLKGKSDYIGMKTSGSFKMALKEEEIDQIRTVAELPEALKAPITKGTEYGKLKVYFKDELIKEISLIAAEDVKKRSLWDNIKGIFNK